MMSSREVDITRPADVAVWEHAEIARSSVEAALTPAETLRVGRRTRQRYLRPPLDTAYPLEYAYALLGDVRGQSVLDLGCGSGANTALLALRGAHVHALDLSPDLIALAQRRLQVNDITTPVDFLVGSAHTIPLPDNSMDVVFGIAVLHHVDMEQTARETLRVLRPGGRAIFQEPVRNSKVIKAIRQMIPYRAPDVSPYERPLTDEEIDAFTGRFRSVRARAFLLPTTALVQVLPGAGRFVDAAYRFEHRLLKSRALWRYAGVRVFEVTK